MQHDLRLARKIILWEFPCNNFYFIYDNATITIILVRKLLAWHLLFPCTHTTIINKREVQRDHLLEKI